MNNTLHLAKAQETKLPMIPSACDVVRFVLKSGAALDLTTESIDEVTESIAGKHCHAVCGCTVDGKKAAIEWNNVDYLVEV